LRNVKKWKKWKKWKSDNILSWNFFKLTRYFLSSTYKIGLQNFGIIMIFQFVMAELKVAAGLKNIYIEYPF
jgi:hypothetical protein